MLTSISLGVGMWLSSRVFVALGGDPAHPGAGGLLFLVISVYYQLVLLTIIVGQAALEARVSLLEALRRSIPACAASAWALAPVALMISLALLVPSMFVIPFAGLVLALYLYVRLSVVFEVAILEQMNPIPAIRRAWALTGGRFWLTVGHLVLQHIVLTVVGVAMLAIPDFLPIAMALSAVWFALFVVLRVVSYVDLVARERFASAPAV